MHFQKRSGNIVEIATDDDDDDFLIANATQTTFRGPKVLSKIPIQQAATDAKMRRDLAIENVWEQFRPFTIAKFGNSKVWP